MTALAIIYLVLHFISMIEPTNYLWGIDSWAYIPNALSLLFLLIALLSINYKIQDWLNKKIIKKDIFNTQLIIIIIVVYVSLLFLFRQSTYFLGDGYLRLANASKGLFFSASEPLDTFLHSYLTKILNYAALEVYSYLSIISGLFVIVGTYYYSSKYFDNRKKIFLTIGLLLTIGAGQLFFGYVESYSIFAVFLILFTLSALCMLKENQFHYAPTIYLAFAILLHSIGIVLLPAYLFLLLKLFKKNKNIKSLLLNIILLILIIVLFIILLSNITNVSAIEKYLTAFSSGNNLLPIFSNANSYGLISLNHLIDILNEILLVFPAIIVIPIIIKYIKKSYFDNEIKFLSILSISFLLFLFIFKPTLGFSRDWDLFSLFSFPMTILVVLLLLKIKEIKLYRIVIPLMIISFCHTFSWVLTNSSEGQSVQRAEMILKTSYWTSKSKALLADDLSHYYLENKNSNKALQMSKIAYQYEKNPRYLFRIATISFKLKNYNEADKYFNELTKSNYKLANTYNYLGDINLELRNLNRAEVYYKKSYDLDSTNLAALNNIGLINIQFAKYDKAIRMFKHSLKYIPNNPIVNYYTAICYVNIKQYDSALTFLDYAKRYGYKTNIINSLRNEVLNRMVTK